MRIHPLLIPHLSLPRSISQSLSRSLLSSRYMPLLSYSSAKIQAKRQNPISTIHIRLKHINGPALERRANIQRRVSSLSLLATRHWLPLMLPTPLWRSYHELLLPGNLLRVEMEAEIEITLLVWGLGALIFRRGLSRTDIRVSLPFRGIPSLIIVA